MCRRETWDTRTLREIINVKGVVYIYESVSLVAAVVIVIC